ncbi:MAG TPA: hypothetical protein VKX46_02445 [Ktedonobacteraceae bacterium]|nr:hypothetical protein [Ktedonobacteraceae bacterium]
MDARFYTVPDQNIDIERLGNDLVNTFRMQGYQAQSIGNKDQLLVQFKKGSDFESFIGMQAALSLTLQRNGNGVLATIGQQKWIDKIAAGSVSLLIPALWPLAITAGVGGIRQAGMSNEILARLDGLVHQNYPNVQSSPRQM